MRWHYVNRLLVLHFPTYSRLQGLTEHPANIKVILDVGKDERKDAPSRFSAPEVIVACGRDGRFYAAVLRTGYIQVRARREMWAEIQIKDCASSTEALQKLYVASHAILNHYRPQFSPSA
jgi:hypothetical protein